MARNRQPIAKKAKSLDFSPATMGYAGKDTRRKPKGNMRRKQSEYATQLNEKQKVKFIYGVQEKQFRSYYEKAAKMQGKTDQEQGSENLQKDHEPCEFQHFPEVFHRL